MVVFDRWFALGLLGIALMVVSFLGEFVFHWWDDLGDGGFWFGLGLTAIGFLLNASRDQARDIRLLLLRQLDSSARIEANTDGIVPLLRQIRDRLPPPSESPS